MSSALGDEASISIVSSSNDLSSGVTLKTNGISNLTSRNHASSIARGQFRPSRRYIANSSCPEIRRRDHMTSKAFKQVSRQRQGWLAFFVRA